MNFKWYLCFTLLRLTWNYCVNSFLFWVELSWAKQGLFQKYYTRLWPNMLKIAHLEKNIEFENIYNRQQSTFERNFYSEIKSCLLVNLNFVLRRVVPFGFLVSIKVSKLQRSRKKSQK